MGQYAKAEPLYRQMMEIRKQALEESSSDSAVGPNGVPLMYAKMADYATSLNSLAYLYDLMKDYAKAEPLYRQALELRKQALGEKNLDYAQSLTNLAALYKNTNRFAKAEPLYVRGAGGP